MDESELHFDPVGFPMVKVPEIKAYVHWLPVTKIQFEHFLCDAADRAFGIAWYEEILDLNPRVTAARVTSENYWRAFLSGILPSEAQRFAFWCGDEYRLPTAVEWTRAYAALAALPSIESSRLDALGSRSSRIKDLLRRAEAAAAGTAQRLGYERRLADQMLMRLGLVEWVSVEGGWGGKGEPAPAFCGNLLDPADNAPVLLHAAEGERLACFGFRLLFCPDGTAGRREP